MGLPLATELSAVAFDAAQSNAEINSSESLKWISATMVIPSSA